MDVRRLRERLERLKVVRSRVASKHVVGSEPLALQLGIGRRSFVGGFIDLVVEVVFCLVVDLVFVVVGVVFARVLRTLGVAALCSRDGCCSYSLGTLASGGVRDRRGGG